MTEGWTAQLAFVGDDATDIGLEVRDGDTQAESHVKLHPAEKRVRQLSLGNQRYMPSIREQVVTVRKEQRVERISDALTAV